MKTKFRIKALNNRGETFHLTLQIDVPEFQPIPAKKWDGLDLPETSIDSQIMDWFDNQDKKDIMDKHDISIIIDYWIYKPKKRKKKATVEELFRAISWSSNESLASTLIVYSKLKSALTGVAPLKQVEITLAATGLAYEAQSYAYKRIESILKGEIKNVIDD